jgi:polysaccharide export outer membrane protein
MRENVKRRIAFATVLVLSLSVVRWPLSAVQADDTAPTTTRAGDAEKNAQAAAYVIANEDTLHVVVWKEPEFTATVPVRLDGKISLPLVNDVQAAGLTPMELAASLTEKLKKFVDDPRVTVVVAQMNHPRIFVIGEVLRHGPISLTPGMTVLQALATSGLSPFANTKKIYVLRSDQGVEQKFPVQYKRLLKGQSMSQNISLKAGDTIVVP